MGKLGAMTLSTHVNWGMGGKSVQKTQFCVKSCSHGEICKVLFNLRMRLVEYFTSNYFGTQAAMKWS